LSDALLGGANLLGADLTNADLRGADLSYADLSYARMSNADISDATLLEANLFDTRLDAAYLVRANLVGTEMYFTWLQGSYLNQADLTGSQIVGVGLDKTWFTDAVFGFNVFSDCDLSGARGLGTTRHSDPSTVGIDTLVKTLRGQGGQFSSEQLRFLEATGVPASLLDYLPVLLQEQPIQFFSCFISYGGGDDEFADRLYRDLKGRGIRCWKYDVDAIVGREVWANIDRAITTYEKMIVICSESSLQRPGVLREIERALQKEDQLKREQAAKEEADVDTDVLVPVRLDDYILKGWEHPRKADVIAKHIGDFRGWKKDQEKYKREFQRLLKALDPRSKLGLSGLPLPS
jgi:hypothetical protein